MILAKTISSCCTSTRRATSSIAIYLVGYRICTKCTTYKMFIELARFLQDMASGVSFFSFILTLFASCLFFSFGTFCFLFYFTPTSFDANTRYMVYELAHTTFARKLHGANVQNPSNHQELASIGQDKHKGMMAIKGMTRVKDS